MKNTEYKLNDFYQSAVLKSAGLPLLRLEKSQDKYFFFIFDDSSQKAEDIIRKYWNKELQVIARELVESIHELKTRLHMGM